MGNDKRTLAELSRCISHALRHEPWIYELELNDEGWTLVQPLLRTLRFENSAWANLQAADLEEMIRLSSKKRHELKGDRIRALYGHSIPGKLRKKAAPPPGVLYHGTSPDLIETISREGLKPMGRQYVHLSVDQATAQEVGLRKAVSPVILSIDAARACRDEISFYEGNDKVWLADHIAATYIAVVQAG